MFIQGERINFLNIESIINGIFNDSEHAKRKHSIGCHP